MSDSIKQASWLDLLVISIISISIISISLLVADAFRPRQALFLGLTASTLVFFFLKSRVGRIGDVGSIGWLLLLIVFCSIIFRLDPYPWINGGQDQGVYVSMSAYYQHGGSVFIEDSTAKRLPGEDLREIYKSGLRKGAFHPGVYYGGEKDYLFQFYHLHPLWMAIFADLFGDDARVYALTFFSLLSILFLSLLALELSGSSVAAVSVGILVAVNPLHAFFSKWPVTEVVALAFSSMAFYYLALAYRLAGFSVCRSRLALTIGWASLSLVFFVRITGFLYLPAIYFIFLLGCWIWMVKGSVFGRDVVVFAIVCVTSYLVSILYGLEYSYNYARDIYKFIMGRLSSGDWEVMLSASVVGLVMAMFIGFGFIRWSGDGVRDLIKSVSPRTVILTLIAVMMLGMMVSLWKVYQFSIRRPSANSGFIILTRASLLNWMAYSSPLLIGAGLVGLMRNRGDWRLVVMVVLLVTTLSAFIIQTPILPYQYYYSRYLLSEAVPYGILVSVVAIFSVGWGGRRWIGLGAVVGSLVWFGFFTMKQFGALEGVQPLKMMRQIAAQVDREDVLFIEPSGWKIPRFGIETPLRFYFGLHTFAISSDKRNLHERDISSFFRKTWLLSPREIKNNKYIFRDRLLHEDTVMERSKGPPLKVVRGFWQQDLFLYELKNPGWPSGQDFAWRLDDRRYSVERHKSEILSILGVGWYGWEKSHIWSSGQAEFRLQSDMFTSKRLPKTMVINAKPFAAAPNRPVSIRVVACEVTDQTFIHNSAKISELRIPLAPIGGSQACDIRLTVEEATSPAALGHSEDGRVLGVALRSVAFE